MGISVTILSQPFVTDVAAWLRIDGAEPTPSPTEVLRPGLSKWDVTPGLLGFLAMFCVVLAAVAVWFSMSGKLRKLQHDERMEASAAQARADGDQEAASAASTTAASPTSAAATNAALGTEPATGVAPPEAEVDDA